jgi:hypothetical protein
VVADASVTNGWSNWCRTSTTSRIIGTTDPTARSTGQVGDRLPLGWLAAGLLPAVAGAAVLLGA